MHSEHSRYIATVTSLNPLDYRSRCTRQRNEGRAETRSPGRRERITPSDRGRREHHPGGAGPFAGGRRGGTGRTRAREGQGHGRAQRGDTRAASLLLLADEPMHGYQLVQAIAAGTDGAWRPSPGAIYPTIAQLEDEGLVSITPDSGRKLVTLTKAGREHLAANAATMVDPLQQSWSRLAATMTCGGASRRSAGAARAVGHSGNDAQIAAAQTDPRPSPARPVPAARRRRPTRRRHAAYRAYLVPTAPPRGAQGRRRPAPLRAVVVQTAL